MSSKEYNFVSLVGRNRMGVVQPFLACREHMGIPQAVHLLVTPSMRPYATDLQRLFAPFGMGSDVVFLHDIDEFTAHQGGDAASTGAEPALPSASSLAAQLSVQGPLAWNLNGGTGAAQTECLLALQGEGHRLVQTTHDGFYMSSLNKKEQDMRLPLPAALPVAELLRIHGLVCTEQSNVPNELRTIATRTKLVLPKNALFSVEFAGFLFDMVWNAGDNVLRFLLCWESNIPAAESKETALTKSRALLDFCLGKEEFKGLFDREMLVMGRRGPHMERLCKEGGDKVHTLALVENPREVKEGLASHLAPAVTVPARVGTLPRVTIQQGTEHTLVMFLQPNPGAVLVALATHRPQRLVLCHTSDQGVLGEVLATMKEARTFLHEELGVSQVEFVESSYEAQDIRRRLPALGENVLVNCTPGTKSQGAHLTLWAKEQGAQVWVLDQRSTTARRLDAPAAPLPMRQPSLRSMLRLCVQAQIDDYGWGRQSEGWNDPWFDTLLERMRETAGMNAPSGTNGGWKNEWRNRMSEAAGERFEKLTAKAIAAISPEVEVAQGVNCIRELRQGEVYNSVNHRLTERDVLATYGGFLFMVSCKARPLQEEECMAAWVEAQAMASTLGRFVVPVLCCLEATKDMEAGAVPVIDWRTLCDPQRLRTWLVNTARQHVRQ